MKKIILLMLISLSFSGCLSKRNAIKDDEVFRQSIPVCNSEVVCQKMWKAAEEWVAKYSPQGIKVLNEQMIQSEEKDVGSFEMEITVQKLRQTDGSYKIEINNLCQGSFSNCSEERENMIAFNKKLAGFMPAVSHQKTAAVFEKNEIVKLWFERYHQFLAGNRSEAMAKLMHFPVTFIEKGAETIRVLQNADELARYMGDVKQTFDRLNGVYLKTENIDVFQYRGNNIYVNVVSNLYNEDNESVLSWQSAYQLVLQDKDWRLISSSVSD